jgi:hypothetical protein
MGTDGYGSFWQNDLGQDDFFVLFVKVEPALCAGFLHLHSPTKKKTTAEHAESRRIKSRFLRPSRALPNFVVKEFFFVLLVPLRG